MSDKIVLKMSGITKRFPGVLALDNVSLTLYENEVHALLGENGAGKSTLMKILSGAYTKDAGEIEVFGKKVELGHPKISEDLGIAIIYQELNLIPSLTVADVYKRQGLISVYRRNTFNSSGSVSGGSLIKYAGSYRCRNLIVAADNYI